MGVLALKKVHILPIETVPTCHQCKYSLPDYIEIETDDGVKLVKVKGEYVRCHIIKRILKIKSKNPKPVRVNCGFANICPFFE